MTAAPTDADFKWYSFTGPIEDNERFAGPFADRQAAIDHGRKTYGAVSFSIVEAASAVFDAKAAEHGFELDAIFERIAENWWAVDEDGLEFGISDAQRLRLAERLGEALADFLAQENVKISGRLLDAMRNEELIVWREVEP